MTSAAAIRKQIARGVDDAIAKSRDTLMRPSSVQPAPKRSRTTPLCEAWYGTEPDLLAVVVPIRLVSLSNVSQREHWATKHKRARSQKQVVELHLAIGYKFFRKSPAWEGGCRITMTRLGPRRFDPGNNEAAMKHCQDSIAAWLGIDDGSDLLEWVYRQETRKMYGLVIRIEPKEAK